MLLRMNAFLLLLLLNKVALYFGFVLSKTLPTLCLGLNLGRLELKRDGDSPLRFKELPKIE